MRRGFVSGYLHLRVRVAGVLAVAGLAGIAPQVAAPGHNGSQAAYDHATVPSVTVSPLPGSRTAPPSTQISIVGVSLSKIGTVTVTGSKSGAHSGTLEAYSQGDGASFIPNMPFTPGELVKVHTTLHVNGGRGGNWQFIVARPFTLVPPPGRASGGARQTPASAAARRGVAAARGGTAGKVRSHLKVQVDHFVSQPNLKPPRLFTDIRGKGLAPGVILITPSGSIGQRGVEIVDNYGHPIWFDHLFHPLDLKMQRYHGQRVLTWWQGNVDVGIGFGEDVVMNSSYQHIAVIKGGNGLQADLHECVLERNGAALITSYQPISWNLSKVGGPVNGEVMDAVVQEVDVATGLVRYQWDSLDHVPVTQSEVPYSPGKPYDYFHVNSIEPYGNDLVVSGRNVSQVYEVSRPTGTILWRLGGKNSTFAMGPNTHFAWQHDVELHRNGTISIFDDEGAPDITPPSRGLVLKLDTTDWQATFDAQYLQASPAGAGATANSQGNVDELPDGNRFVGWGSLPFESEFSASGTEILDLRLPPGDNSYRAYKVDWVGTPTTPPAIVVKAGSGSTTDTAFFSWNGATGVATWQVLGGASPSSMSVLGTTPRRGFERHLVVPVEAYYEVEALNASGGLMSTSEPVQPTP